MSSAISAGPVGYTGFVHPSAKILVARSSIGGASLIEAFVALHGERADIGVACNLQDNDRLLDFDAGGRQAAGDLVLGEGSFTAHGSVVQGSGGGSEALGDVRNRPPQLRMPILPFKLNQDRRRHIPRQRHRVTNWPAYDASLRQRGSLTVWFADDAIAGWAAEPRTTRGGQP